MKFETFFKLRQFFSHFLLSGGQSFTNALSRSHVHSFQLPQRRAVTVAGLFGLGVPELVVIAGVAVVLFGPKQLPELGKNLGKTVKSFQEVRCFVSREFYVLLCV